MTCGRTPGRVRFVTFGYAVSPFGYISIHLKGQICCDARDDQKLIRNEDSLAQRDNQDLFKHLIDMNEAMCCFPK